MSIRRVEGYIDQRHQIDHVADTPTDLAPIDLAPVDLSLG